MAGSLRNRLEGLLEKKESPARQDNKLRRKVQQILRNEKKVRGRDGPTSGLDSTYVMRADVAPPPEDADGAESMDRSAAFRLTRRRGIRRDAFALPPDGGEQADPLP